MFDNGRVGFVIVILTELPNYELWTIFFTLTPSGDPPPGGGGVELASYDEAMAQLGRVSPEQTFVGIGRRGSNLGPLVS